MADKLAGKLPASAPANIMTCACGATFDSHNAAEVEAHAGHIHLAQRAKLGGW